MKDATRENVQGVSLQTGYGGQGIQLSSAKPEELKDAPSPRGTGYYGWFALGTAGKLAIMVDVTATNEDFQGLRKSSEWGTLYVDKKPNGSLAGVVGQPLNGCCGNTDVTLPLDYEGEVVPITVSIFANVNPQYSVLPTPTPAGYTGSVPTPIPVAIASYTVHATLSVMSVRVGQLPTGETFILESTAGTVNFEKLGEIWVLQDINGDGIVTGKTPGETLQAAQAILIGSTGAWKIHSVSPSGMKVQLLPKQKGVLTGKVATFVGTSPIPGVTVKVWPGEFETTTKEDGTYRLEVYEGAIWKILATKEGYIPSEASSWPGQYRDSSQQSVNINIRAGKETSYNTELAELPKQSLGTVTLEGYGSFYAALGLVFRNNLGDFTFQGNSYQTIEGLRTDAMVCACQESQRGLVEMGDQGSKALDQIAIPPFGYTQSYVQLRAGSVYVVKAREGMEGHFVIFRVDSITQEGAKISYLFR